MSNYVPPVGPKDAKIVIVGDAPGGQEVRHQTPFVGEAGLLLDKYLSSAGIPRSACYITYVIKERPPANRAESHINIGKKEPVFSLEGRAHLESFYQEMDELNPNLIICLGNLPLWALSGEKGITKWRGSVIPTTKLSERRKMIATFSPAQCVRNYEWRHLLGFDIRRAAVSGQNAQLPNDTREYIIRPGHKEALDFLRECGEAQRVGSDIEVSRGEVACISFSPTKGRSQDPSKVSMTIPFWSAQGHTMTPPQEAEIWKGIADLFEKSGAEIIFHNSAFDWPFIFQKYGIRVPKLQDTMIAQAILWPDFKKSLADTVCMYTNMPYYKDEGKEGMLAGGTTYKEADDQFWTYCAKDSVVLPEILQKQIRDLKKVGNYDTYLRQKRCVAPIVYLTTRGIKVDKSRIATAKVEADKELAEIKKEINQLAGYEVNPASPKQLKQLFYEELKETPSMRNGKPSTDEKAMKIIARRHKKGAPIASKVLRFRKLAKMSGTYYGMQFDDDKDGPRLRCSINPVGTETGRFSSRKTIFGTGGNMQNMPKAFKGFLVPDPDCIFYEIDLSQAENRIVAFLSKEEKMLEAFANNVDIHSLTASLMFSGEATKAHQDSIIAALGNGSRSQRYWGKQANHALNYDMGSRTASLNWEIPIKDAEYIVRRYHAAYPRLREWHRRIESSARNTKSITNLYGRTRRYLGRWGKDLLHEMYAFSAQSVVADHMNVHGFCPVYEEEEYRDVELLLQVHDSIVVQIKKGSWTKHASLLNSIVRRMQTPIVYEGRELILPADVQMFPHNLKDGFEIPKGQVTPSYLEQVYNGDA